MVGRDADVAEPVGQRQMNTISNVSKIPTVPCPLVVSGLSLLSLPNDLERVTRRLTMWRSWGTVSITNTQIHREVRYLMLVGHPPDWRMP